MVMDVGYQPLHFGYMTVTTVTTVIFTSWRQAVDIVGRYHICKPPSSKAVNPEGVPILDRAEGKK